MPVGMSANIMRAVKACRPQTHQSIRARSSGSRRHSEFHTRPRQSQQAGDYQRYGPAAGSNLPPPAKPPRPYLPSTEQTKQDQTDRETKQADRSDRDRGSQSQETQDATNTEKFASVSEEHTEENSSATSAHTEQHPQQDRLSQLPDEVDTTNTPLGNKELDMVLSVPSPSTVRSASESNSHRHPHLEAPPYEHHFDTYSLVTDLASKKDQTSQETAFTSEQAVTLMKAIRLMLAQNLDLAKDGLVSKSDTENESYLFRAACSELKTTMLTARSVEAQKQRSQRAHLQHEYDILNQKVNQDIAGLREELRGMFNDRKLRVQEDKRVIDGRISGLNYHISVDLNSEARSEVEGLRWVLTRRAVLAIAGAASMIVGFLQYYSVETRKRAELEKKRRLAREREEEAMKRDQERFGTTTLTAGRSSGTQTDGIVLGGTAGGGYGDTLG